MAVEILWFLSHLFTVIISYI